MLKWKFSITGIIISFATSGKVDVILMHEAVPEYNATGRRMQVREKVRAIEASLNTPATVSGRTVMVQTVMALLWQVKAITE